MYEQRIVLGFVRIHILHHAAEDDGVYGAWIMNELRRHGYSISPGTLYPILHEMEESGMLRRKDVKFDGRIRKIYMATSKGRKTLEHLKSYVSELSKEVR